MSQQLQTINELSPIALELRERQELILGKLKKFNALTADMISDASDQGRAILLAKTKLGKHLKWSDWLNAHVPNLDEQQADKYERIAVEQITDTRQCIFAFLPPAEREAKPVRTKPAIWESAWAYLTRLNRSTRDINTWPHEQVELTRQELTPTIEVLGGKVTWLH